MYAISFSSQTLCRTLPLIHAIDNQFSRNPRPIYTKTTGITITVLSPPGASKQFRVDFYASCSDGIQNQDETGIDCGGSVCSACVYTCGNQAGVFGGCGIDMVLKNERCEIGKNCTVQSCCVVDCANPANLGRTCDDGNPATVDDECMVDLKCEGTVPFCSVPSNAGKSCDDGNPVTIDDRCVNLKCEGTLPFCSVASNAGKPCDDGNPVTENDRCVNLKCEGTLPFCSIPSNAGLPCNDGNPATENDKCVNLKCEGTLSFCSIPSNAGLSCDDGNPGTENDKCANLVCVGSPAVRVRTVTLTSVKQGKKHWFHASVALETAAGALLTGVSASVNGGFTSTSGWIESNKSALTSSSNGLATFTSTTTWSSTTSMPKGPRFCVSNVAVANKNYVFVPNSVKDCSL